MPSGTPWPQKRKDELERRWNAGQRRNVIIREMGITPGQLAGQAMRLNLHNRGLHKPHDIAAGSVEDLMAVSRFGHTVRQPAPGDTLLKDGRAQRKIGGLVTKGDWRGYRIFTITLQERATCPRTCAQWLGCYGNQMNWARRWQHGDALESKLWDELGVLQHRYPGGFVVRLHILGDFYSTGYVDFWHEAIVHFPALRVFGYTAWPHHTRIGRAVRNLRDMQWEKFAVRTSGANYGPATVVIERPEDKPADAIICPAQTGATRSCGTCGLCWAPAARGKTIAFLRH